MSEFVKVLVERDGLTLDEAVETKKDIIRSLRRGELEYEDLEELLHYDFGLEPDYIFEF